MSSYPRDASENEMVDCPPPTSMIRDPGGSASALPSTNGISTIRSVIDRWRRENAIDGRYVWLPVEWEGDGPAPMVLMAPEPRGRSALAPGLAQRIFQHPQRDGRMRRVVTQQSNIRRPFRERLNELPMLHAARGIEGMSADVGAIGIIQMKVRQIGPDVFRVRKDLIKDHVVRPHHAIVSGHDDKTCRHRK